MGVNLSNKPLALQRLRRACEQAKMKLSQYNQARIDVNGLVEGIDYMCNISRPHFEDLCKDDIECMLNLVTYVLEETGLEKHDVHEVVLVGGLARMPLLRRTVREYFHGKVPREVLRPDHAAVLGAAVYGAVLGSGLPRDGEDPGSPPAQLQHLKLTQVSTWSTMASAAAGAESSIIDIDDFRGDAVVEQLPVLHHERRPSHGEDLEVPLDARVNWPRQTTQVRASKTRGPGQPGSSHAEPVLPASFPPPRTDASLCALGGYIGNSDGDAERCSETAGFKAFGLEHCYRSSAER